MSIQAPLIGFLSASVSHYVPVFCSICTLILQNSTMSTHPPQTGSSSSDGNNQRPRRDSSNPDTSRQVPAWPYNLPDFPGDDFSLDNMFASADPPLPQADVPVLSTEASAEAPSLENDASDSELSETTSSSEDEGVEDPADNSSVRWVRAHPPRPARYAFQYSDDEDEGPAARLNQNNEDDRYDWNMHYSLAPRPARAIQAVDVFRAGPSTAAGRAQLRRVGIVNEERGRQMERRQRVAVRRNERALGVLREGMEEEEEEKTDEEGALALGVETVRM